MIAHSGIGMRIRGLLKYLGPLVEKENFRIYLFGNKETILKEGIPCYEFSGFSEVAANPTFNRNQPKQKTAFSFPVISYRTPIYSFSEFLGHPLMKEMDLLDIPHFNAPIVYLSKCIVTIHDIIPFRMKEFHSSFVKRIYMQIVFRLIRRFAKQTISVSKFTANDLNSVFGFTEKSVKVVYNGIDETVFYPAKAEEKKNFLKKYKLKEGYLLSVGIGKGHKNLNLVLKVIKPLWDSQKLKTKWVLGGSLGKIPDYLETEARGYEDRILPMPKLVLDELRCLYSCASLLVFPSRYEGFGFPPLEAQACACPVLSSNATVMPEVLKKSVLYFSPDRREELESQLKDFFQKQNSGKLWIIKGKKNSARFTWKKTAEQTLEVYKKFLSELPSSDFRS